jgi:hypothetical protein
MELTREQIKDGNEKLAKFIGWHEGVNESSWYETIGSATYVAYSIHNNYPHRDLPFHRDWNYLMKVIDKIGELNYRRSYDAPDYNWKLHYSYGELFNDMFQKSIRFGFDKHGCAMNLMNDIESIWCGCVAFIDYNNSKNK